MHHAQAKALGKVESRRRAPSGLRLHELFHAMHSLRRQPASNFPPEGIACGKSPELWNTLKQAGERRTSSSLLILESNEGRKAKVQRKTSNEVHQGMYKPWIYEPQLGQVPHGCTCTLQNR